ncbi:MAG: SDR family oxidoreductase [Marinifilaceae bacterium]|jgi:NADP-dependent 3-hydroxy acid dehydrogenase YdfG|nr:SDR family oxidoreductase [Marinifilaceae bacterium]
MNNKGLIVITGASSGIGEATAKLFSEKGHPLLLLARRLDRMESLNLPNCLCRSLDVVDYEKFKECIKEAESKFGDVEAIVNNAGVMLLGDLTDQSPEEWKRMLDVNMLGVLNGMQLVLPKMKERKGGTIINVSSVAGRKNYESHAAYCGTKFGVHAITEGARIEAALNNVRMVTIAPGAVETELLDHTSSEDIVKDYQDWKEEIGGVIRSEDIANAIWYAFNQPQGVNVREIVIAATKQAN